jgi:hypothetical protein
MRVAIRLLTAMAFALFVVAIVAAQHGAEAQATKSMRFPGIFEFIAVVALLALTLLLSLVATTLGLAPAIRAKEQPWVIAIALSAVVAALIYLGLFLPDGFLLPVVRILPLPSMGFWGSLLVFIPALLGDLFLTVYSLRAVRDAQLPLYTRLGS